MSPTQHSARSGGTAFGKSQQPWPERLRSNWPLVTVIAVWVLANAVVFLWPTDDADREYYEAYIAIWRGIEDFRSSKTDAALWDDFAEEQLSELQSIVDELDDDASPSEPTKQQLLWAGRDYLVPLLEGKVDINDDKLRDHMDRARRRLRKDGFDVEPLIADEPDTSAADGEAAGR